MNRKDFDISLKKGEARENALRQILGEEATIEVKSQVDSRSHVFIEHEGYGEPSGIAVTKAQFWVIETYPDMWCILPTPMVRQMHKAAIERWGVSSGGDENAARGAAVPKKWLVGMR